MKETKIDKLGMTYLSTTHKDGISSLWSCICTVQSNKDNIDQNDKGNKLFYKKIEGWKPLISLLGNKHSKYGNHQGKTSELKEENIELMQHMHFHIGWEFAN